VRHDCLRNHTVNGVQTIAFLWKILHANLVVWRLTTHQYRRATSAKNRSC